MHRSSLEYSRGRRLRSRSLVALAAAFCAVTASACGGADLADGVSDSTFVAAMADLERIERASGEDSTKRVADRTAALQRRGLSRAQLEAAAAALAADPERALALYRAIELKVIGDSAQRVNPGEGSNRIRRR